MPTKCGTNARTCQDPSTAKEKCQETLFFLPFRKTLPGLGTVPPLPRPHHLPEPFSSASCQLHSGLTRVSKGAPAEPGTVPFRATRLQLHGLEQMAWALGPQFTCMAGADSAYVTVSQEM